MDPLSRIGVSQPASAARLGKRKAARSLKKKKGIAIRVPPRPLGPKRAMSSPPALSASLLPTLSILSPLVLPSPKAPPHLGAPLTPLTPATPAWPGPMGSRDGRRVHAYDSDGDLDDVDDVDEPATAEMPSDNGRAVSDDDAPKVAPSHHLKVAHALTRMAGQQMPPALGLLWQGDDGETLRPLLKSACVNVYERGGPLQINSIMLAHRLNRVRCAKVLFEHTFDSLSAPLAPVPLSLPHLQQLAIAQNNVDRRACNDRLKTSLYERCQNVIGARLQGEASVMISCAELLHQNFEGSHGVLGANPGQRRLAGYWIQSGILGHLLNHFDQEALQSGSPLSHWPQLLTETAQALGYPLDKDHLLIGLGQPACGGAPERG